MTPTQPHPTNQAISDREADLFVAASFIESARRELKLARSADEINRPIRIARANEDIATARMILNREME